MDKNFQNLFLSLKNIKKEQDKQKKQGINDYNLLTTVLKANDEVRLHSRMIASLLDVDREHYRGCLFLKLFLEKLDLPNFFVDLSKAKTQNEYDFIDIYITDGSKHIILENKIYAQDADAQLQRYIEKILQKNRKLDENDILVIYLSIDRDIPSTRSLGNLTINQNILLKDGKNLAKFKAIKYKDFILSWLEECQEKVKDIPNLYFSILQYIEVVKKITNSHERKIMPLTKIFENNKENYDLAHELVEVLPKFKNETVKDFFHKVKNELKLNESWECCITEDFFSSSANKLCLIIRHCNQRLQQAVIAFSFDDSAYRNPYFGVTIVKRDKNWFRNINSLEIRNLIKKYNLGNGEKENPWWFPWKKYNHQDFVKYILFEDNAVNKLADILHEHLEFWKERIEETNLIIEKSNTRMA